MCLLYMFPRGGSSQVEAPSSKKVWGPHFFFKLNAAKFGALWYPGALRGRLVLLPLNPSLMFPPELHTHL
jgi:hypothetical protein